MPYESVKDLEKIRLRNNVDDFIANRQKSNLLTSKQDLKKQFTLTDEQVEAIVDSLLAQRSIEIIQTKNIRKSTKKKIDIRKTYYQKISPVDKKTEQDQNKLAELYLEILHSPLDNKTKIDVLKPILDGITNAMILDFLNILGFSKNDIKMTNSISKASSVFPIIDAFVHNITIWHTDLVHELYRQCNEKALPENRQFLFNDLKNRFQQALEKQIDPISQRSHAKSFQQFLKEFKDPSNGFNPEAFQQALMRWF